MMKITPLAGKPKSGGEIQQLAAPSTAGADYQTR
jgi:hypothetical protein